MDLTNHFIQKKFTQLKRISASMTIAFLVSCSPQSDFQNTHSSFDLDAVIKSISPRAESVIQVVNQANMPVANAMILVGMFSGSPFKDNYVKTDSKGQAVISKNWTTAAPVTIEAAGYVRQTWLNQKPGNLKIKLNPSYAIPYYNIQGQVTQLPVVNGDKQVDFGLVVPAMTKSELMNFDIGMVISPYKDKLTAVGQTVPLPSNVSLPQQKESYIIGINISKPTYRYYTPTSGTKRLFAMSGRFPFKQVVDTLRSDKPFYEVINLFDFQTGSLRDVTITDNLTGNDIPGNELTFDAVAQVTPPTIADDQVLISLAMSDASGTFIPTDVKKAEGKPMNLKSLSSRQAVIVNVIKKQSEFMNQEAGQDHLSASILPYSNTMQTTLLPLIDSPTVTVSPNDFRIKLPAQPETVIDAVKINPLATVAVISDVSQIQDGDATVTLSNKRWEIYGQGWANEIQLPNWPFTKTSDAQKLDLNLIGSQFQSSSNLGDELVKAATHITHTSTAFKY